MVDWATEHICGRALLTEPEIIVGGWVKFLLGLNYSA